MTNQYAYRAPITLVAGLVMLLCTRALADESDLGRTVYRQYCSACHGSDAKGDGVVSHLMQPKPNDLTQLARKNGGKFPFYEILRIVDGRDTRRAHGDPNMPVWGALLTIEEGATADDQLIVRGKVVMIVDYLERIQSK